MASPLRYIPGEDADMIETEQLDRTEAAVVVKDEVEDDEIEEIEPLLTIDLQWRDDLANALANIVIKNIDNLDGLSDERVRFFFEEISDCVAAGLDLCDFSEDNFQMWNEIGEGLRR